MRLIFARLLLLSLLILPLAGCQENVPSSESEIPVRTVADAVRSYDVRGKLIEIRQGGREALIAHEEIPGYMSAMTMPFAVKEPAELSDVAPGDVVTFRYEIQGTSSWITRVNRLNPKDAASLELSEEPEYTEPTDASIYFSSETWTNQEGDEVNLAEFQGQPVVLSMIFTRCGYACPLIVRDMKRIAAQLPASGGEQVRYILVSLDPERDTPEALKRFAEGYDLDLEQWTLLRGDAAQVRLLAALLGVRYRQQADGQFAHTSLITVLNEHGEIVHQQKGQGADGSLAAEVIGDLLTMAQ